MVLFDSCYDVVQSTEEFKWYLNAGLEGVGLVIARDCKK